MMIGSIRNALRAAPVSVSGHDTTSLFPDLKSCLSGWGFPDARQLVNEEPEIDAKSFAEG
jgi:hypothetical protein